MLPKTLPPWLPYTAPFALFLLLTSMEGTLHAAFYPVAYTVKIILVGLLLIGLRRKFPEARPGGRGWAVAALLGAVLTCVWLVTDHYAPHFKFLGHRTAYNPLHEIPNRARAIAFLCVRFFGLVVIAPMVEELFYRSFLLRFVTDMDDFQRVPLGTWTPLALGICVMLFAVSHPEWLSAAIFALAMCLLLRYTKNLFACILAHATTNLLLGVYILQTGQWQYW